ncbi:MAG: VWA domain-containing protein [Candidatus Tectomicrobia bacterium]|nr:VWA domain-containing protein [Candidatus Tectomicrobia bacterium]
MVMRPIIGGTLPQRRIRTPGRGLQGEVIGFCRVLRRAGLKITSGRIVDLFRSFDVLDITDLENLYIAGKSNLVCSQEEQALYDALFRQYWFDERAGQSSADDSVELDAPFGDEGEEGSTQEGGKPSDEGDTEGEGKDQPGLPSDEDSDAGAEPGEPGDEEEGIPSYSPAEVLSAKDFSTFEADQVAELRRIIAKLVPKLATKISRRKRPDMRSQEVDLRRSVKRSIRTGGEVLRLFRRKRRIQKTQIILLCDVSGSMDSYSQFLIQFLYSLQNEIKSLRTFVFSTRLTDATPYLRHKDVSHALRRLSQEVHDWSGGTQIGNCLKTFNFDYGRTILNSRTIVIIISDGWDRGDTEVLSLEMDRLRRKCYRLIWLNPLLGSPGYRPIDRGMRTALPYCDEFMSAHNLDSLVEMTGKIARI